MELVDDEDVEIMVALYCGTRSNQNVPIQLLAELAGVEPTKDPTPLGEEHEAQEPCMVVLISSDLSNHEVDSDSDLEVDEVLDDIDDEGVNENGNVNASSVGNQICRIVIHNNPEAHMSRIDPDAAYAAEFSKYLKILPTHWLAVDSDLELFVGQRFESKEECVFSIKRYSMNISMDYKVGYLDAKNGVARSQPDRGRTRVCQICQECNGCKSANGEVDECRKIIGHRPGLPPRSYGLNLQNRQCNCRRFQTLHYPCTHVVVAYAKVSFNVEQFIDEVYTIECTLRVWENEFPLLFDLSIWEVPLATFELVPDKGLRRNPKGRLQLFKIHNEMDIWENLMRSCVAYAD
ncbi:hypothetical protein GOBAR_DD07695 [Gossypium barbadense]|nr:hypothetical protein GOBAR_DD07695 [Gossypium barbadense]